jgi:hypothetical protein
MTPLAYNVSILGGVTTAACGAGLQWGWPVGMLAAGLLIVALSVVSLVLAVR